MQELFAPARLVFSPQNLWLWIATLVLLAALVNGLTRPERPPMRWPHSLWREGGRFLYFVGLPYVALLGGLMPATQIGLVGLDWWRDVTLALPLGLGAFLGLLFLRLWLRRQEETAPGGSAPGEPQPPWWVMLRESVYQEAHWAFYRSAPLLAVDGRAKGIALGLGIVALEAWLNPAWRAAWRHPGRAATALRAAGLAVMMAVVFGVTGNWWLTVGLHVAIESACRWAWPRLATPA